MIPANEPEPVRRLLHTNHSASVIAHSTTA